MSLGLLGLLGLLVTAGDGRLVQPDGALRSATAIRATGQAMKLPWGDGEIDFRACHRVLQSMGYQGWLIVDLDIARQGPLASYQRCGSYVVDALEPVYA